MKGQIKERTYLGEHGRFTTVPEYPEFAWKKLIVNAIAHRDYSIKGTDIQIKMFDDHITVESPGTLPGIVRLSNMRQVHFSRNPKIAEFLHEYDYVKEFGEGVDRLFLEMQKAGLTTPVYEVNSFMLNATISNIKNVGEKLNKREESILVLIRANPHVTIEQLSVLSGVLTRTVERNICSLKKKEYFERNSSDVKGEWIVKK